MESALLPLKSVLAAWLSSSTTLWVTEVIIGILCGLGLFRLSLPFWPSDPSSPLPRKPEDIRKCHLEPREKNRRRNRSATPRALREFLRDLKKMQEVLLLQRSCRHTRRLPDNGDSPMLFQDHPCEGYRAEPAGAHWPCGEPGDSTVPAMWPSPFLPPPATDSPPLTSTSSPGPVMSSGSSCSYSSWSDSQPPEPFLPTLSPSSPNPTDSEPCPPPPVASFVPPRTSTVTGTQCDSMALRLGALPWSLSPYAHWLASPTRVIPDIGRTSSPIPAPSRCQADAKAWSLLTCLQCESQQEQLPQHPTEVSFRGDPTDKPGEACTPSLVNPDTQKLREILITRRTEQKMWKEKEKGEGSDHRLNCLRNKKSLGEEQGANVKSLGESTKGKPEQPASREKPPDTKALGDHLHQKCEQLFWGIPFLHSEALETNARESGSHQEICSISFNEHSHASPFQFQDRVRFAVNQALDLSAESNTHWEARNPAPSKGQGPNTSTSHGFAIFRPPAQQILEARVTGLQARRRWRPPLKIPKVINSFKLKKSHPWPLLCSRCTCSATCVPGAQLKAKFSQFSEKPQSPLGDKATKKVSIPSPVSHLPVPSPTYEEFQKAWGETPPGNGHVSSEAPLTTQVSRPPAQTMFMSVGRMWHSEMAVRAHKARLELSQGAATARNEPREESRGQAAQDSHCRVTTVLEVSTGSRSSSANEDRGSMAAEEASAWKATLESTVPANSRITNVDLRSGTPGTSKIPTLCVIQDLAEPCLDAQHSDAELHEQVESGKQPPDSGPDELVPYCHAHTLLPHCHSPAFLAADSSDSETSVCSSQSTSSGDTSAMDMSGDITLSRWASHRSSQGLKSCQLGQEEKQAPPESHFTKRQHFLQGISSSKVPQQKGRPPSATAESQGQDNSRSVPDSGAAEAQGIETAVGWTLEEKIRLQHGRPPSESNWHKGKFQAPVERGTTDFSYHRLLSYEEQGRVTREDACNHQATLKGHSSPGKSRWTRDKDDNRAFPPREPGCQHRPRAAGASACTHHCPRHPVIQRHGPSVQLEHNLHAFPGRTSFLQENIHTARRKPGFLKKLGLRWAGVPVDQHPPPSTFLPLRSSRKRIHSCLGGCAGRCTEVLRAGPHLPFWGIRDQGCCGFSAVTI